MFDLDDCIGFITNRASKIIVDEFNRRLKSSGLTRVKWMALYYIGKEEGISQKELSHKMNVNESSIVRLLDRMEKEELSVRVRDTHDRRITKILLTPKGKALRKAHAQNQRQSRSPARVDGISFCQSAVKKRTAASMTISMPPGRPDRQGSLA